MKKVSSNLGFLKNIILVDRDNYVAIRDLCKAYDLVPYSILIKYWQHTSQNW